MKYLVMGLGKSGTTALFFSIKSSIGEKTNSYFEPKELSNLMYSSSSPVVVKFLIDNINNKNLDYLHKFDKKTLIIRDPRDLMVSKMLYRSRRIFKNNKEIDLFLKEIRKKELDPNTMSLLELFSLQDSLTKQKSVLPHLNKLHDIVLRIVEKYNSNSLFILKYEDYVTNNVDGLIEYLGLKINPFIDVDSSLKRVQRTKSFGDWKNWFTEDDVSYVKNNYAFFMEFFGYTDWAQPQNKIINSEFASHYVKKILDLRKQGK